MSFANFEPFSLGLNILIHWSRVTHMCVSKLTTIGSYNGLSPDQHQALTQTNAGKLIIGTLGISYSGISS